MKIHIIFNLTKASSGGGNNFLRSLKEYFKTINVYSNSLDKSDVILFNSHHQIPKVIRAKRKYPKKIFIQRIDGPIKLYNSITDKRDSIVNYANKFIADGTIFQSNWSKNRNIEMGIGFNNFNVTILNAPNKFIFNHHKKKPFNSDKKIKLIATSWSSNIKKGFDVYKWLDANLDFNKYEMTFVGNSPVLFNNIRNKKPMNSKDLATELKENDIYITASKNDPCSNSLIEALHCGLPSIGLNEGGHPEIISSAGEIFDEKNDISELLKKISSNYLNYQKEIKLPDISIVGNEYYLFFKKIYDMNSNGVIRSKKLNNFGYFKIYKSLIYNKLIENQILEKTILIFKKLKF